ncbi:MAG: acyl carrier protein [Bauldia sp.]
MTRISGLLRGSAFSLATVLALTAGAFAETPAATAVRQYIAFNLGKRLEVITPERMMMEDLCEGDEVILARLFNKIVRQFKIDPSIDEMSAWVHVGDIVAYVETHAPEPERGQR